MAGECKVRTGIDDHSRFVVTATVLERPTGNAVCDAFTAAMHRCGVPFEVLTDNGKQFTGRFTRSIPAIRAHLPRARNHSRAHQAHFSTVRHPPPAPDGARSPIGGPGTGSIGAAAMFPYSVSVARLRENRFGSKPTKYDKSSRIRGPPGRLRSSIAARM